MKMIALFGDLGAGKTAFTRGLCAGLGITDGVSSPTFAIVNAYRGKYPVYHFDMYRITSIDDLFAWASMIISILASLSSNGARISKVSLKTMLSGSVSANVMMKTNVFLR